MPEIAVPALVPNASQQDCGFFLVDLPSAIEACESGVMKVDKTTMLEGPLDDRLCPSGLAIGCLPNGIHGAIAAGVPLWNSGDQAGCVDVYMTFAREHQHLDGRLRGAIQDCAGKSAVAQGWILRHAFDRILAGPKPAPPALAGSSPAVIGCDALQSHATCKRAARALADAGRENFMPCMNAAVESGAIDHALHPRTEAILACPLFAESVGDADSTVLTSDERPSTLPTRPLESVEYNGEEDCDKFVERAKRVLAICGKPSCCGYVLSAPECEYSANALFAAFPPAAFERCALPSNCEDKAVRLAAACATQAEVHRVLYDEEWAPDDCDADQSSKEAGTGARISSCTLLVAGVAVAISFAAAVMVGVYCGRKRAEVTDRVKVARVFEVQPADGDCSAIPVVKLVDDEALAKGMCLGPPVCATFRVDAAVVVREL